jgi:hypothetical protein
LPVPSWISVFSATWESGRLGSTAPIANPTGWSLQPYGWPADIVEDDPLVRLLDLNRERAAARRDRRDVTARTGSDADDVVAIGHGLSDPI